MKSLLNLIIGRDNRGSSVSVQNEPGNQMATVSMNYFYLNNKNARAYLNVSGQDEAGYLPSRIIFNFGHEYKFKNNDVFLTIDYTDTETKNLKNYSYNHNVYKSGWRYKGLPIGASIDADSKMALIKLEKLFKNDFFVNIKLINAKINQNNSELNSLSPSYFDLNSMSIKMIKNINNYSLSAIYQVNSSKENSLYDKNFYHLRLEYKF